MKKVKTKTKTKLNLKIIIPLIVVVVLLLIIVILLVIIKTNKTTTNNDPNEIIEGVTRITNKSKKIKKRHCLDNFCIDNMEIVNDYDYIYIISGDVVNNSNKEIKEDYVKLVFTTKDKEISIIYNYSSLTENATYPLEIHHNDKDIVNATDYKIVKATNKEINEYKSNIEESNE
jgi:hypothetical protein